MADTERLTFIERLFKATAFDYTDDLFWREREGEGTPIDFYAMCNDIFWWATADLEEITPLNIHLLEGAIRDCAAIGDHCYGVLLFCARAREMRPMARCLEGIDTGVRALFESAGPERETGFLNPACNQ